MGRLKRYTIGGTGVVAATAIAMAHTHDQAPVVDAFNNAILSAADTAAVRPGNRVNLSMFTATEIVYYPAANAKDTKYRDADDLIDDTLAKTGALLETIDPKTRAAAACISLSTNAIPWPAPAVDAYKSGVEAVALGDMDSSSNHFSTAETECLGKITGKMIEATEQVPLTFKVINGLS